MLRLLSSAEATAFLYTCHNAGTSGAIRQGLAAGRPLLAMSGCRQFRDLETLLFDTGITWVSFDVKEIAAVLIGGHPAGIHLGPSPRIVRTASVLSWAYAAQSHLEVYRRVLETPR